MTRTQGRIFHKLVKKIKQNVTASNNALNDSLPSYVRGVRVHWMVGALPLLFQL